MGTPQIVRRRALGMQACVPKGWSDEQVKEFADRDTLCGTQNGWVVNKELGRVTCESDPDMVHVVLDA